MVFKTTLASPFSKIKTQKLLKDKNYLQNTIKPFNNKLMMIFSIQKKPPKNLSNQSGKPHQQSSLQKIIQNKLFTKAKNISASLFDK
jgi:hypothetical protein